MKLPKLYWIEWIDSSTHQGWQSKVRPELKCWTIGFLMQEDDESVVVASSYSGTGHWCDPIIIPRVSITKMQEVVF